MAILIDMAKLVKNHFAHCEQAAHVGTASADRQCDDCGAFMLPLTTHCEHAILRSYSCEGKIEEGTSHPIFYRQYAGWK